LWNLWGADLPSVANIKHRLIFEENFNEKSVAGFVKDYIETIEFAALGRSYGEERDEAETDEILPDDSPTHSYVENPAPDRRPTDISTSARSSTILETEDIEIAKFPVGKNCTIRIISNRYVSNKAIQALVAQLQLNPELGVFDDELES